MRLALLLAAALGVHADVQAPDMDPERKAEIAKKVREFQEMTRQNPALARPNTDAMYAALGKSRNCSHHILDIFADRGYENEEKQSVQLLRQCKTLFYNETVPFTEETKGWLSNFISRSERLESIQVWGAHAGIGELVMRGIADGIAASSTPLTSLEADRTVLNAAAMMSLAEVVGAAKSLQFLSLEESGRVNEAGGVVPRE